jgi:hypothetical protein
VCVDLRIRLYCARFSILFSDLFFLPSYAVSVCAVAGARLSLHMCSVCSTMVSAASMQVRAALASMGGGKKTQRRAQKKCVTIKDTVHTRVIVKGH